MGIPTWENITVQQYQTIHKIVSEDYNELDTEVQIMACLLGKTQDEINDFTFSSYIQYAKDLSYLFNHGIPGEENQVIPGKAKKYIKANGNLYKVNYEINKHRFGQYIEQITFKQDLIGNLHLLTASIVNPVKRIIGFKKVIPNNSRQHEAISNDFLQAKFIDVYHAAVFFYRVYKGSMMLMEDYLEEAMMKVGMSMKESRQVLQIFMNAMDGLITPKWLPTLKISV